MAKVRVILNPNAGGSKGVDWLLAINASLRKNLGMTDVVILSERGDAELAAEDAARCGYSHVFAAGGDGTLNEVVNGVARVPGALDKVIFGLIPAGTGNDFAESLGIPNEIDLALEAIFSGKTISVDLGKVNDRWFVNVSAGGFIAEVSEAVTPGMKTVAGRFAYLIGGAQQIFEYEAIEAKIHSVDPHGAVVDRTMPLQLFAVANARMIGGGRPIAPYAVIDDGLFDVCLVEAMPPGEFLGLLTKVPRGHHVEDERVRYFRARELDLSFDHAIHINTDGEVLETDRCSYRIVPRAARFLAAPAIDPSIL